MSELSARYNPTDFEEKWYAHWEQSRYFSSTPDEREPFTILIPPPNVTGVLHMGHMLNNTIQDVLIRKARLDGKNACWVPGTDHASIATEAKVVRWLREEKQLRKADLTREEFMAYAYQWKEKYGGIILKQLRKLGSSCDWDRTAFTMDPGYYADCIRVFVDLHGKGKLYRGLRMVNWDPEALTVLSNEEVLHSEEQSSLYHIRYAVEGNPGEHIVIATQRPETIFADVAVAVHPKDARYKHLVGKNVLVPLIGRAIPVIADDYVDIAFGTGALKITPAHDPNDYEVGQRHSLPVIDILTDGGQINEACNYPPLVGLDRFAARKAMMTPLQEGGFLEKLEDYTTSIGRSERTGCVVEPKLSLQWFVRMDTLRDPALQAVMKKDIQFLPTHMQNTYRHWMSNIRDWCISRQLWWGQRIPAWYLIVGGEELVFVAETADAALEQARTQTGNSALTLADLRQDEDVLDTWASSWLWPISVFDGFKKPDGEINYYYPADVIVTGWDIMFFWIARMIMAGYEFRQERPFKAVYFTGMVRDKQRRKMSKSLGNSPDALKLLEDFGADSIRYGMLSCSPAGGDVLFDEKLCENGRNFCNKLWNALRLVKGWEVSKKPENAAVAAKNALAVTWLQQKMKKTLTDVAKDFKAYRLSDALMKLYSFIWDDFCAWYLEMVKPTYGQPIDQKTLDATLKLFSDMMVALHPFMPFITEEIWHQLSPRATADDCMMQRYPKKGKGNAAILSSVETAKEVIGKIRDVRNQNQIKPREELDVFVQESESARTLFAQSGLTEMVVKLACLGSLSYSETAPDNGKQFIVGTEKYFVAINQVVDVEAERERITKDLTHARGFVSGVEKKLSNERFVSGAPAQVLEVERKKLADGQARIIMLEESLAKLH